MKGRGFQIRRTDLDILSRWWWTADHLLLGLILLLGLSGLFVVATASPAVALRLDLNATHFTSKHMIFTAMALIGMVVLSAFSQKAIWRFAFILMAAALCGVVLTLLSGMEVKGATRWLSIAGFSVQPSEFLKPALVVVWAWLLAKGFEYPDFPGFLLSCGLYAVAVLLLMLQPDFGMSVIVTIGFFVQIFLAGCPLRYIGILAGLGVSGLVLAYFTFGHVQSRIDRFLDPDSGDSYQVDLSLRSFMEGGLFGKGPGQGEVKYRLPDAHADFTFAVLAEEMGLIACLLVLGLYGMIALHAGRRLWRSGALFPILAGGGLLTIFMSQIIVHIGSSLQLLPAKGMTLPFLSYGGSSLLAIGVTFGMLLALTRRQSGGVYASHSLAEKMQTHMAQVDRRNEDKRKG